MRVVSWNLNHWQQSNNQESPPAAAWEYLRSDLHTDVALVQEAVLPTEFNVAGHVGLFDSGPGRSWGTGIVDLTGVGLTKVNTFASPDRRSTMTLNWSNPGAAAAAHVGDAQTRFLAVSLYGQFNGGSSYATMLHHAADLAPLFNDFKTVERSLIAGDFNLNGQWGGTNAWFNEPERTILRTFSMWGMHDLLAGSDLSSAPGCACGLEPCRHIQTYWKPGSGTPWQNDHALGSPKLKVEQVRVEATAVTEHRLSDHAPIVIDLL